MHGTNPKRPPTKGDGLTLEIQEIFPTLQGEGPYAGWPSVFIRLGGCNLACSFCDTEFESFRPMPLDSIIQTVRTEGPDYPLVVITGGEPFRQPIGPLCTALLEAGYEVQVETNGTLYREIDPRVSIICSPKNPSGQYAPIHGDLLPRLTALKFLLSAEDEAYHTVPELGQSEHHIPVYVQPIDTGDAEENRANTRYTVDYALTQGYRLSLQLHKIVGIA